MLPGDKYLQPQPLEPTRKQEGTRADGPRPLTYDPEQHQPFPTGSLGRSILGWAGPQGFVSQSIHNLGLSATQTKTLGRIGGGTFLVPLTERERIPGTWALPPFPSVRTQPSAPCQEAGAELCQGPRAAPPGLWGSPRPAFYPLLPW